METNILCTILHIYLKRAKLSDIDKNTINIKLDNSKFFFTAATTTTTKLGKIENGKINKGFVFVFVNGV